MTIGNDPPRLGVSTQGPSLLIEATEEKFHPRVSQLRRSQQMAVAIKPLEDRIVVKAIEAEKTTASGLVIPDTAKEKPQEGTVIAVGPGRFDDGVRVPMDVKVGDVVLYSKYGGTEVKYNNEEYLVLSARDILAVIEMK